MTTIEKEGKKWRDLRNSLPRRSDEIKKHMNEVAEVSREIKSKNVEMVMPLLEKWAVLEEHKLESPVPYDEKIRAFAQNLLEDWSFFLEKVIEEEQIDLLRRSQEKQDEANWNQMEMELEEDDNAARVKLKSLSTFEEYLSREARLKHGYTTSKPGEGGEDDGENSFIVRLQERVDWESFSIDPPFVRFPFTDGLSTSSLKASVLADLHKRCAPEKLEALKKRLNKFIMVVKHKETGDVRVLTKQEFWIDISLIWNAIVSFRFKKFSLIITMKFVTQEPLLF